MARKILIQSGSTTLEAEIDNSATADAIWQALPIKSTANTWGQEIYFEIPVKTKSEKGKEIVNTGDIAYWPPGKAFCIFFGPTPVSRGTEIRAASEVNVFGKITGDMKLLSSIKDYDEITVNRVQ